MALPRGAHLSQVEPNTWQRSWSEQHPATRWVVTYQPPGRSQTYEIGIIASTRLGAKGHNRHTWYAITPTARSPEEVHQVPSVLTEGVYNRRNRTEAVKALIDAWRMTSVRR